MTAERLKEAERLLVMAREALRFTREYVGEERLPNIEGWSHYDATVAIDAFLDAEVSPVKAVEA